MRKVSFPPVLYLVLSALFTPTHANETRPTIVVIGATAQTAEILIPMALEAGHKVVGIARRPEAVKITDPNFTVLQGDVYDRASIEAALTGKEIVLGVIGPRIDMSTEIAEMDLFSTGYTNIIAAMQARGNTRLIATSSIGAQTALRQQPGEDAPRAMKWLWQIRGIYDDTRRMEAIVMNSGLDYTILRAAQLMPEPARNDLQIAVDQDAPEFTLITYTDFARFILDRLIAGEHVKHTVAVFSDRKLEYGVNFLDDVAADSLETFQDCASCPEMVSISSGSFVMGATRAVLSSRDVPEPFASFQAPAQEVEITNAFAIGRYPVTRAEFLAFVAATGRQEPEACWSWNIEANKYGLQEGYTWSNPGFAQTDQDPVVCVSWQDAQDYVEWLSQITGETYRLPSESEREYVARSGSASLWPWGDRADGICAHANISDMTRLSAHTSTNRMKETLFDCEDGYVYTSPVGTFQPNALGLYDTVGNVWEWQADCFQETYAGASLNGTSVQIEPCEQRTLRGGSWLTFTFNNWPAARYGTMPGDHSGHIGFRVARSITAAAAGL